jgi:GNAT superfamily N-acetyltransferase
VSPGTGGLEVRAATAADLEALVRLRRRLWPRATADFHLAELAALLADPTQCARVAVDARGDLRGFAEASLRRYANGCATSPVGFLEGWFVDDELRRRGIGRALVAACERWAAEQGCTEMGSDVDDGNELSNRAHEALGFRLAERVTCFAKPLVVAEPRRSARAIPSEVEIVAARAELADSFHACLDEVARERRWLAIVEAFPVASVRDFVAKNAAGAAVQFFAVTVAEDRVAGWCDVIPKRHDGFRHSGVLGMGVLAPWRGRGLGGALLETTLAECRSRGITRIELEVYASNAAARELYAKRGFVVEGVKRGARILDGVEDDNVVMALRLFS